MLVSGAINWHKMIVSFLDPKHILALNFGFDQTEQNSEHCHSLTLFFASFSNAKNTLKRKLWSIQISSIKGNY